MTAIERATSLALAAFGGREGSYAEILVQKVPHRGAAGVEACALVDDVRVVTVRGPTVDAALSALVTELERVARERGDAIAGALGGGT